MLKFLIDIMGLMHDMVTALFIGHYIVDREGNKIIITDEQGQQIYSKKQPLLKELLRF